MTTRRSFTRLMAAGLGGSALLAAVPSAFADGLADIMKAGTIRVAVPQDFPPSARSGRICSRRAMISTWPGWSPPSWA